MQNEPFDKDYILKCCEGIYSEAFDANACIKILLQIGAYHRSGYKGTDCSPVFYYTVCSAMIRASIMDIARIYDEDSRSISLSNVNNYCNKYAASFPDFTTCKYEATDETVDIEKYPLEYELTSEEIASEKSGTSLFEKIHKAQTLRQSCGLKPNRTLVDVYSKLLDNYKSFSTKGKSFPNPSGYPSRPFTTGNINTVVWASPTSNALNSSRKKTGA